MVKGSKAFIVHNVTFSSKQDLSNVFPMLSVHVSKQIYFILCGASILGPTLKLLDAIDLKESPRFRPDTSLCCAIIELRRYFLAFHVESTRRRDRFNGSVCGAPS